MKYGGTLFQSILSDFTLVSFTDTHPLVFFSKHFFLEFHFQPSTLSVTPLNLISSSSNVLLRHPIFVFHFSSHSFSLLSPPILHHPSFHLILLSVFHFSFFALVNLPCFIPCFSFQFLSLFHRFLIFCIFYCTSIFLTFCINLYFYSLSFNFFFSFILFTHPTRLLSFCQNVCPFPVVFLEDSVFLFKIQYCFYKETN